MGRKFFLTKFDMRFRRFVVVFTKYCTVGVVNTLIGLTIMVVLKSLGANYLVYTAVAYICGMCVSFYLNFKLTFAVKGIVKKRFVSFVLVNLINLIIVEFLQWLLINRFNFKEIFAVGIGMVFYVLFGFLANQKFVFYGWKNGLVKKQSVD